MNIIQDIFAHEVYPAMGCTEPVSCAYAAAVAAAALGEPVRRLQLAVDPATYKNGMAVTVPNSNEGKGNLIAAALGAIVARPDLRLEILTAVDNETLTHARAMLADGRAQMDCLEGQAGFRVEATVDSDTRTARCVLAGGHTNIARLEVDGRVEVDPLGSSQTDVVLPYRQALREMSLADLIELVEHLDENDMAFMRRGIEMNQALAQRGFAVKRCAYQLKLMMEEGFAAADLFYRTKLQVASAVDARMAGVNLPAMTSGGSGNQGILVTLLTHSVGSALNVPADRILRSLALAHAMNAYIKCYVGELAVICGCAVAAGVAAAIAIVYQQAGAQTPAMASAVGNVIGDLSGMICDGAKPGCAMKVITCVDSAIRSSLMALKGHGASAGDGIVGRNVEESIRNLGRLVLEGMPQVDPTVLRILRTSRNPDPGRS